jgi:hypothetical protein
VVRRAVGHRRYEGLEAAAALGRLYAVLRLFVNFFQPSFKLAGKVRDGAKVSKTYHSPATPYQRLLADARTSEDVRCHAIATYATLDPVRLLKTIREVQQELVALADRPVVDKATEPSASTLEQFLSGLRTAWQEGEVRPTGKPKEKAPRGRRRPDPFARVTELLREWFEAEPWRTSRELFERLQKSHPDLFPDGQLRTLQRRVKTWRRALAHKMVFGAAAAGEMPGQALLHSPDTVGVAQFRDVTHEAHVRSLDRRKCATVLTPGKVRCSPSSPCSRARARCGWLRVAPLLPIPSAARRGLGSARSGRERQARRSNRKAGRPFMKHRQTLLGGGTLTLRLTS